MRLLRGRMGAVAAFLAIAALVTGGLGWVTREALRMEAEGHQSVQARQREKLQEEQAERLHERKQQVAEEHAARTRTALMLCDSRLTPALAREDSRPYAHYEALHTPFPAITLDGLPCEPGQFLVPSPLLTASLPDWMLLHFQVDPVKGWTSPQVIGEQLQAGLRKQPIELALNNVDDARRRRLQDLRVEYPVRTFFTTLSSNGLDFETVNREAQQAAQELNVNPANSFNYGNNGTTIFNNTYTGNVGGVVQNSTTPNSLTLNNGMTVTGNINPQQQLSQLDNNDQAGRQRFSTISRGKNEGLQSYLGDGRTWTTLEGIDPYRRFGMKQREFDRLQKSLDDVKDETAKASARKRLDGLQKELEDIRRSLQPVEVELTPMRPVWLPNPEAPKHLLMVRPAKVGTLPAYQGIVLDWGRLQEILKAEIDYLLPDARFVPLAKNDPERLQREMFALPIELDAGPPPAPEPPEPLEVAETPKADWTPLRIGLSLAWLAAVFALTAVGLGGWTLLDLSERRIRFVSAVTHELRTPLTTLRLYLDLLNSGLVSEESQRDEYVKTLSGEADRLHRLIGNVLDFARLEKTRPTLEKQSIDVAEMLNSLRETWMERCSTSGKQLEAESTLPAGTQIRTDRNLVEQILGNLIDNARKYSRDAADPTIVLRAGRETGKVFFEVEDRGPGVTKRERRGIFRPFRRGHDADVKAGGVGLGLALATRWATFVGGRLSVGPGKEGVGACFRLELPE